jgi:predicted ester cyclase
MAQWNTCWRRGISSPVAWCGTQTGSFAGVAATGRSVAYEAYHIVRFQEGKAAEWSGTADIAGARAQLAAPSGAAIKAS